ncbi:MAG: DNA-3-methyladenine glycosylase [candidate division Zixibacteria bacterium]|nr:DNA-3-methyladenine glycosylase [candidate division Zixibacteria bacterium]
MIKSTSGERQIPVERENGERCHRRVSRQFFDLPTLELARALLGKLVVREIDGQSLSGRIVETEAYLGRKDPASHAFRGVTRRNSTMFGPPGYAYVYFVYGNHYCLNVVSGPDGTGEAVLVRALQPISGIEQMKRNRRQESETNLANGPGKLCQALSIDTRMNGTSFESDMLYLAEGNNSSKTIARSTRVGISKGKEKLWRFYLKDNPFVSNYRETR